MVVFLVSVSWCAGRQEVRKESGRSGWLRCPAQGLGREVTFQDRDHVQVDERLSIAPDLWAHARARFCCSSWCVIARLRPKDAEDKSRNMRKSLSICDKVDDCAVVAETSRAGRRIRMLTSRGRVQCRQRMYRNGGLSSLSKVACMVGWCTPRFGVDCGVCAAPAAEAAAAGDLPPISHNNTPRKHTHHVLQHTHTSLLRVPGSLLPLAVSGHRKCQRVLNQSL